MQNYLCGETRAKGNLDTEFMFDEMSQAVPLPPVCMQNMSLPRRNALEASIYYLMAKHFGSTKTSEMQN